MEIKKLTPAWVEEFKAFALKGNVMDMAVGVIIGGAFGKIVTSLVNDVIMPAFAMVMGGTKGMAELTFQMSTEEGAPVIKYGAFCQSIVDFLIISLAIFFAIRMLCKLRALGKKKEAEEAAAPAEEPAPAPTPEDILLLREIRDALKNK